MQTVSDTAGDFTRVDIELHYRLSVLSGNPVFTLILNGFTTLNRDSGLVYFASSQTRDHSRSFYKKLLSAALSNDVFMAEELTRSIMRESLHFWNELFNKE